MKTAFLALGSNVGDREANLRTAVALLQTDEIRVRRGSSLYETAPQELLDQPSFLNAVLDVETSLFPMQLLARVREIERQMGRRRVVPKGPRNIDIDILFYGRTVIATAELEVPHPRIAQRRFVLEPLAEIAPDFRHPQTGKTANEMLATLEPQGVRRLEVGLLKPAPDLLGHLLGGETLRLPRRKKRTFPAVQKIQNFTRLLRICFLQQPSHALFHHVISIVQQQTTNVEDCFGVAAALGFLDQGHRRRSTLPSILRFRPTGQPIRQTRTIRDRSGNQPGGNAIAMRPGSDALI